MKTNPSIRIISGSNKGFKINFKPSSKLRPTSDRLKKIAFDWVQFNILNSNCLDLFAGTGSLGLECLSRNASKVTFVDHTNDHINKINKLAGQLNYKDKCECIRADVSAWMHSNEEVFDLIFMDPPYEFKNYEILLETIALNKMLSKNGFIFLEHAARIPINIPDTLKAIREKKVGEAKGQLIQWK